MTGATGVCAVSGFASPLVEGSVEVAPGAGAVSAFTSSVDWGFACGTTTCSGLRSGCGGPSRSIAFWIRRNSMEAPIIPCPAGPESVPSPLVGHLPRIYPFCGTDVRQRKLLCFHCIAHPLQNSKGEPSKSSGLNAFRTLSKKQGAGKGSICLLLSKVLRTLAQMRLPTTGWHDAFSRRDKT